jgi:hypothetical protein
MLGAVEQVRVDLAAARARLDKVGHGNGAVTNFRRSNRIFRIAMAWNMRSTAGAVSAR